MESVSGTLTPTDARQARRIVGYLEYGMALGYLDELLRSLTPDERTAIDEFVAEHESFTVYTNLSRRTQTRPSTLTERPSSAEDSFARKGLAWVMALARVESGAILSTFTTTPNPFTVVNPTAFEMNAYRELLMDGARMHYWSLYIDPALKKVTRTSPENPIVLSYSRRLGLAKAMLRAAAKSGVGHLHAQQYRELATWKQDLDELHAGLLGIIQSYLISSQIQSSSTTSSRFQREFTEACYWQLRAEKRELEAGNARVIKLGD